MDMRRKFLTLIGGAVAAVCWTVSVSPGQTQESEKAFYAGKTVRMLVGSGVGGGYDVFSRLIAPYLAKTLGTTVIVENVPGAGGLVSLNRLYVAPPDGLTISLVQGTMATLAQLMGDQAARYRHDQVHLSRDRRRAARTLAGGAGLAHPRGAAGDRRQEEMALGLRRRNVRAWASARPSPARRSSSIAISCRDTRAAPTPALR